MTPAWALAPPEVAVGPNDLHVWRARLDLGPDVMHALEATLAPDECLRAARFRRPPDRARFIASHGALRTILARYVRRDPARIRLGADPKGKPQLAEAGGLRFNLSHSAGLALCAVTRDAEIGVDVEHVQAEFPCLAIATRFFAPAEAAALRALPIESRPRAFFDLWARKEAYLKARGDGLRLPLDGLDTAGFTLLTLPVGDGYAAAVAFEGTARVLRFWDWSVRSGEEVCRRRGHELDG